MLTTLGSNSAVGTRAVGTAIVLPDLLKFDDHRSHALSNKIISRLRDLEKEYKELIALQEWNNFVATFNINMQVRLNQDYYLYESGSRRILSIIPPEEMLSSYIFHGKTRLSSEGYFVKG
jgi:hypothetical protein